MPVFTFEKISPPVRRGPLPPIAKKQRGVIVKILNRFVEARVKRTSRKQKRLSLRARRRREILRRRHQPDDVNRWDGLTG